MRPLVLLIALLVSLPVSAADEQQPAASPYMELNKQLQERLRAESFYNGPINGDFGYYTQAALAQFQLSRALPASGSLDAATLAALGLEPQAESAGQTSADAGGADPQASNQRRCDALMGQEKEHCLQQGGTLEASTQSGSGASAPAR